MLVGDLRIVGDHIELDIQLVAVESGMELYSDRIFWETSESGAVPEEILNKLLTTLKVHLNDVVRTVMLRTGTNNAEAFLEMQRSRRTLNAVTAPDLTLAAKYARNALALDPEYEGAYRCLLIVYERMAQYVSVEQNEIIRREVERIVFDLEQHLPGSEVHGLAKFIAASLDNDRLKMVSSLVQAIRANPEQADVEDRAVRPYPTFGGELLLAGLIEAGDAYMRRYFEVIDIPYKPPLAVVLRNGGIDAVMDRRKELIARDIEVIRSLSGLSTDYARKGDFEQARESLSRLDQEDKAGIWAHGVRHIVMALEGRLTNGSAAHTEFTANPITVDIQRGTIAFINGELSDGIRYWNNLGPAERRFLNMNLLFMEHYLSDTILQDEAYIALKDRLGVGPQWRNYLKAKVIELEPFTGIGLSGEMATSVAYID